ncbi:MAG: helix-turn-helix transcriptional regulator [Caenibius sp.]
MQPVNIARTTIALALPGTGRDVELPLQWPEQGGAPELDLTLTCWSRLDGKPRLIIKRDGSLVACSEDVPGLVRQHECFRLHQGRIMVIEERGRALFARLAENPDSPAATMLLRRADGEGHWIVRVVGSGHDMLFVTLQAATADHMANLPDLCEAFGFTRSEAQIVRDLFSGMTPQAIAEEQGISIHTVRAHVRRCYDKLQITSREELWHRLSAYQI